MSETTNEDSGAGRSVEESSNGQQRSQSAEALAEWRSSDRVENGTPSTSPPYWDIDEEDDFGLKPSELFGKDTWKIEKFSEINKRELRGDVFEVGGYKWYILIYPQGCDVCNHLSLFLCVADHDKLLPGWSHFAQFTIAVINKDPKKSKHSDTLHRFWKKEHDWGWKKFIELPKLQEGFIDDSGSLIIKAQVQVIRERVDRPFRCLFFQYRRELVRVYMNNVEQICGRFVEEKRSKLGRLIEDKAKWKSFGAFWIGLDQNSRRRMSREKMDVILKIVVKHFFIEKEVTSTLVMDSLYSGLMALEGLTKSKKSRPRLMDTGESTSPMVSVDKDMFVLVDDVLLLIERAALEPLPPKEDKGSQNRTKDGNAGEFRTEAIERDEKRLTELGRRTVEIFALTHIFSSKIEVAYQEAIAWRRQEELIREEEEEWLAESEQKAKRGAAEREKKSKKKQAKQKKNKNRGKEKRKEEKVRSQTEERDIEKEECVRAKAESSAEKPDTLGNVSDVSDSVDSSADILQLDSEDRESSPVHWEIDASEIPHPPPLGDTSRGRGSSISIPNGVAERKCVSTMDDSSSTCSNDSIRSGGANGSYKGSVSNCRSQKWLSNGKTQPGKVSDSNSLASETEEQPSRHASGPKNQSHSSEIRRVGEADVVISHIHKPKSPGERKAVSKDHGTVRTQEKCPVVLSSPGAALWNHLSSVAQAKPEKKGVSNVDAAPNRKAIPARSPSSDQASPSRDIQFQTVGPRADVQKTAPPKPTAQPAPSMSRPLSAPLIPPKQTVPVISPVQASTTPLARSMSSTGRVGSPTHSQTYIPQSYKHAIVGSFSFSHSSSQPTGTTSALPPYSHPPPISVSNQPGFSWDVSSAGGGLWTGGSSSNRETTTTTTTTTISGNHRMNLPYNTPPVTTSFRPADVQFGRRTTQSLMTDEFPHLDIINDLLEDEHGSSMDSDSVYRVPQRFNNTYSYHGGADFGISGRSRSYSDDGFHQTYGEYMSSRSASSSSSPYGNGQMDGLTQAQWRMANMDLSLLAMRNQDDAAAAAAASNYSYFDLDSSNPNLSAGFNGYRDFRPSNGY